MILILCEVNGCPRNLNYCCTDCSCKFFCDDESKCEIALKGESEQCKFCEHITGRGERIE